MTNANAFDSFDAPLGAGDAVPHAVRRRTVDLAIVGAIAFLSIGSVLGFLDSTLKQHRQNDLLETIRDARVAQQALSDAETALHGYVLTGHAGYLQTYYAAVSVLQHDAAPTWSALDSSAVLGMPPAARVVQSEIQLWNGVIGQVAGGTQLSAIEMLGGHPDRARADGLREELGGAIDAASGRWDRQRVRLEFEQDFILIVNATGGLLTILALLYALHRSKAEAARREGAIAEAVRSREAAIASREEVRQVFAMAEALQSANGLEDGAAILRASAIWLMPRIGGALYVFNHPRDRLDLTMAWAAEPPSGAIVADAPAMAPPFLLPGECWALKRSKPHLNGQGADALRCSHAPLVGCSLELPMVGRSEAIGVLVLTAFGPDAEAQLEKLRDMAGVLADSMSLAVSSIMLREKLRNDAVRDSLTGLYNRRFLEEVLHGMALQAQRRHASLAAIMIDLDHFKRLNDEHGHAMGDSVLKSVGRVLWTSLRASDIACRYGGEELLVLLPDCTLDMARQKAEQLRERIHRLSRVDGPQISASLGVSALPASAREGMDLLSSADMALYKAKQAGRNRVVCAGPLALAEGGGIGGWRFRRWRWIWLVLSPRGSSSFLKKRTKKLFTLGVPNRCRDSKGESLFASFSSEKEVSSFTMNPIRLVVLFLPAACAAPSLQCAPFARAITGVSLHAAAADWWGQAAGRYRRTSVPVAGGVLVFARSARLPSGHVSVVSAVVAAREILLTQANWVHGRIGIDQPAEDVSPANDWTRVRVFWPPTGTMGRAIYPADGFILPSRLLDRQAIDAAAGGAPQAVSGPGV